MTRRSWMRALALVLLAGCGGRDPDPVPPAPVDAAVREAIVRICALEECTVGVADSNVVEVIDVRGMSAADFQRRLDAMPGRAVHLWMPGATRWVLVGRPTTNAVDLALAMERFADDPLCTTSIPEVFASYVGTREDVMPAFASDLQGDVLPEWFVTRDIPTIGWLDGSGVDADILKAVRTEIRSMQVVRREILDANMMAARAMNRQEEYPATDRWSAARKRNPRDPMLLERIGNLSRNAQGFLKVGKVVQAMKCYETIVLINPNDAAAVHNFGVCMKRLGRRDIAEQVLKRAEDLAK